MNGNVPVPVTLPFTVSLSPEELQRHSVTHA